ncbi:DUF6894 family protein [Methylorubrum rhodesianum]|uniref:DUF6894 family protein n=1 Tax=Methylorubrum rhodesianum TaxID=29427 RepID=UPI003D2DFC35
MLKPRSKPWPPDPNQTASGKPGAVQTLRIIGELMVDNAMGDIWSGGEWVMTVADETGQELFSIRLSTSQRNGAGSG